MARHRLRLLASAFVLSLILLSPAHRAHGQAGLSYRWAANTFITLAKDTSGVLVWKLDTAAFRSWVQARIDSSAKRLLRDSIDAAVTRGATIKRDTLSLALLADLMYSRSSAGGVSSDSIRRLGRSFAFTSVFVAAVTDTNQTRYFGAGNSNAGYAGNRVAMLITDRTLIVNSIAMVHVWDSSSATAYFQRDTVVDNISLDSIPRGSTVWIQYRGAAVFGSPGVQTVRIWYKLPNSTTHDQAGMLVQIPLILGVPARHMGLGGYVSSSHSITVTATFIEKIPGLVY